jgi:hypothetical protein
MTTTELNIRNDIHVSAKRMIAGLKVAKREQSNLAKHIAALDKHGDRGSMSKLAEDTGISRQLVCEVLKGRKKIGAVAALKIARAML